MTHAGALWRALQSGVWGDPRGSTVEAGAQFYEWIEEGMVKLLADVDETYRRLDVRS